jgi:hypothetical protein
MMIVLVWCCSCKKVVHLKLDDAGPHIFIQGEVTDVAGPCTVKINRSVSFDAENSFPPVSGGRVTISDSEGNSDSLIEASPGVYTTTTLQGRPGVTYTMSVQVQDTLFTAVSTMPFPVPFDSITFRKQGGIGKDITAVPNFQDPAGVKNYYMFYEFLNGRQITKDLWAFDDRLSDGRYITRGLRNDSAYLAIGDMLEIRMYCIDKPNFDYFNQLQESEGGGAFNTTASPSNPASNISNGALGYFSAHTIRTRKTNVRI